ncbi:MAG: YfiR family protein [Ramlibacter sp.]|nr:YfiR family protein [Ramlibacter sp.]
MKQVRPPWMALALALALALLLGGAVPVRPARAESAQERATAALVKAVFLHKFASFVEWPAGSFATPTSPLKIGVLGDPTVWKNLLDTARDRDRDGRPVWVTQLTEGAALTGYHILYLKVPSEARLNELLAQVPAGVLTVTDSDGAPPRSGVIHFFLDEGRIQLEVSPDAAARQGLRLSPRLLSAARSVRAIQ